jgi:hypothetical protein
MVDVFGVDQCRCYVHRWHQPASRFHPNPTLYALANKSELFAFSESAWGLYADRVVVDGRHLCGAYALPKRRRFAVVYAFFIVTVVVGVFICWRDMLPSVFRL